MLRRSHDGTWIAVSHSEAQDSTEALSSLQFTSACIATLVRFKYIRDFSISEDLTCKFTAEDMG